MNSTKLTYAKNRINEIYKDKEFQARAICKLTPVHLTNEQKIKAIKEGAYTVDKSKLQYHGWTGAIVFNDEKLATLDTVKYNRLIAALSTQKTALLDQLMLGDETQALLSIQAFANYPIN